MPAIRFPASAIPLLSLCKGHGENFIFRTYADLIGFLAAYGFKLSADYDEPLPTKLEFASNPNAIELDIFSNRGLYSNFLIIAMWYETWKAYSTDDDLLCKLIEKHVALGAIHLSRILGESDSRMSIVELLISDKIEPSEITI